MLLTLKILLVLYSLYALVKFFDFFYVRYERRISGIRQAYENDARTIRAFDAMMLVLVIGLCALLYATGVEYLSFVTGLLVGMTLIQVYFHRFLEPLAPEKSPEPPVSPLKLMSFAIQASPALAWRELTLTTILLVWGLYMLATRGFGMPMIGG